MRKNVPNEIHKAKSRGALPWLSCHTQEEIAKAVGVERSAVTKMAEEFVKIGNLAENHKAAANHSRGCVWEPPVANLFRYSILFLSMMAPYFLNAGL